MRDEERSDPIGYLLTWVTYGTWLPGDNRGWVMFHDGWRIGSPKLEASSREHMTETAIWLGQQQRIVVECQIRATCQRRGWQLFAVNCSANHVHAVVATINTRPKKIRRDLKSWTTRRLQQQFDQKRRNWWAQRGSIRIIYKDAGLEAAIKYVNDGQD